MLYYIMVNNCSIQVLLIAFSTNNTKTYHLMSLSDTCSYSRNVSLKYIIAQGVGHQPRETANAINLSS